MEQNREYHYLALGDSYTIGEGLAFTENYPSQLAAALRTQGFSVQRPLVVARTGWTTADLKQGISDAVLENSYDLVTLLIGVNNQYQALSVDDYGMEFRDLLGQAIRLAGNDSTHVIVISIPDYSVTPFGLNNPNHTMVARELDLFNEMNRRISRELGVKYIDITEESRRTQQDAGLLADDGLHYSSREYGIWASTLLPVAVQMLQ